MRRLIVLVLIVGTGLGWIVRIVRTTRTQREAVQAIKRAGGGVAYDWQVREGKPIPFAERRVPRWLADWFEGYYFGDIISAWLPHSASETELIRLENLSRLEELDLSLSSITDEGMEHLKRLTRLKVLELFHTAITDAGMVKIEGLTNLEFLDLSVTAVSDSGLTHLRRLSRLRELKLGFTKITDAGLAHLAVLPNLEAVCLDGTGVTDEGVALLNTTKLRELGLRATNVSDTRLRQLGKALPKLTIRH